MVVAKYLCLFILLLKIPAIDAKVEAPNYDFSLDQFNDFTPGKDHSEIKKKYPNEQQVHRTQETEIYKVYISHIRYKFALFYQTKAGKVTDYYATLPSYFLHDIFHQSLINRIGKQQKYFNKNEHSVYIWPNSNGLEYHYEGSCTITCFPIFLSVVDVNLKNNLNFVSIKSWFDSKSQAR